MINSYTPTTETYDTRSALIVTAGVGNTYIDIANDAVKLAELIKDLTSKPDDGKLEAGQTNSAEYERNQQINQLITGAKALLLAAAIARSVDMAVSAGTSAPAFGFYGYGSLTVESSSAKSTNTTSNERQNNITAGSLIDLTAGTDANIYGSQLISGGDINITAQNLTLEASKNNQTSGSSSVYDSATGTAKTTGTFGGRFTHAESGSDLTATTNIASNIAGQNVNINTAGNTNVLGSVIAGSNSVLINADNLNITTLQDVLSSTASSHSYTFGTDIGFSISSSSHDKLWAGTQAAIVSGDALDITVADNTNLTGSLLNSQTGNLNLATNTLIYSDLQQSEKDWNYAYSLGMSFSVDKKDENGKSKNSSGIGQPGAGQDVSGRTGIYNTGSGSTTIGFSNSGFEKEGVAKATVGEGNITTASNVDGLNRDETQSMLVTKNDRTGGLDGSLTIDNMIVTDFAGYKASVLNGVQKMPEFGKQLGHVINTSISLVYGGLGYAVGKVIGGEVDVTIRKGVVQFEGNPLATSPFTLGGAVNYPGVGDKTGGPEEELSPANGGSYTKDMSVGLDVNGNKIYPVTADHEEGHVRQSEREGIMFLVNYVISGVKGAVANGQSVLTHPAHKNNSYELEADSHAKEEKIKSINSNNN